MLLRGHISEGERGRGVLKEGCKRKKKGKYTWDTLIIDSILELSAY